MTIIKTGGQEKLCSTHVLLQGNISRSHSRRNNKHLTHCLLVLSADNLYKKTGPRSGLSGKSVRHSDGIPERMVDN